MFLFFALIMNVGAFAVAFRYFVYDAVLKCGSQSVFVFFPAIVVCLDFLYTSEYWKAVYNEI